MNSRPSATIHELAAHRLRRQSVQRARSGERRQFLWSWPATGLAMTVDFPFVTPRAALRAARTR